MDVRRDPHVSISAVDKDEDACESSVINQAEGR